MKEMIDINLEKEKRHMETLKIVKEFTALMAVSYDAIE